MSDEIRLWWQYAEDICKAIGFYGEKNTRLLLFSAELRVGSMRSFMCIVIFMYWVSIGFAEVRNWNEVNKKSSIRAEYDGITNEGKVRLRRQTDGKIILLPIDNLSKKDSQYIENIEQKRIDTQAKEKQQKIEEIVAKAKQQWQIWEDEQSRLEPEMRAYELKGDRLGMSLEMFKGNYYRVMPNDPRPAPFCSDSNPQNSNPFLLYKAELAKAGIVHARTTFPYEEYGLHSNVPTVAGVAAELYIYQFVEGKLYEITIFFPHDGFQQVLDALKAKYGEPKSKDTRTYQNLFGAKFHGDVLLWTNLVSEISLFERAGSMTKSLLIISHKDLSKRANERIKKDVKPRIDDL